MTHTEQSISVDDSKSVLPFHYLLPLRIGLSLLMYRSAFSVQIMQQRQDILKWLHSATFGSTKILAQNAHPVVQLIKGKGTFITCVRLPHQGLMRKKKMQHPAIQTPPVACMLHTYLLL